MAYINYYLKGALSKSNIQDLSRTAEGRTEIKDYQNKLLQIYISISSRGTRIKIYTKQRVEPKNWDPDKQRLKPRPKIEYINNTNKWLNELYQEVSDLAVEKERSSRRITIDEVRNKVNGRLVKYKDNESLENIFNSFIRQHKTAQGNPISSLTAKQYTVMKNHLVDFTELNRIGFNLDLFEEQKMSRFKDFLYDHAELSDNTVRRAITCLKVFIKYLASNNYIRDFDLSTLKYSSNEGEIYVVPFDILLQMQNAEIENTNLSRVRDVFLFQSWTGQRYSDIYKMKRNEIIEDQNGELIWDLVTVKTKERVRVPIIKYARQILNKYKNEADPIPKYVEQEVNRSIKEVGEKLGLNWTEKIILYYRGKPKEEQVPFYKVLSTHVARKSFITNALILGVPERVVREVSKHKDERSFRRYVKFAESFVHKEIRAAFEKKYKRSKKL